MPADNPKIRHREYKTHWEQYGVLLEELVYTLQNSVDVVRVRETLLRRSVCWQAVINEA